MHRAPERHATAQWCPAHPRGNATCPGDCSLLDAPVPHAWTHGRWSQLAADESEEETLRVQLVAGGLAGGSAAAVTTPLDVVKTRLQTAGLGGAAAKYGGSSTAVVSSISTQGH